MANPRDKRDSMPVQRPRAVTAAASHNSRRLFGHFLEKISSWSSRTAGSSAACIIATLTIAAWLLSGPLFHYSDTW